MLNPLITYITVVRNGDGALQSTIESILPFLNQQVEYVIVDGQSTDGTRDVIETYASHLSSWISEEDEGIYDAMNKGIKLAKGAYVCFVNIGDKVLHCPLAQLQKAAYEDVAAVSFPVLLSNGKIFKPSFSARIILENTLHHQGTFYCRHVMQPYDLRFKTFADWNANQQLFAAQKKVRVEHAAPVCFHSLDGTSHKKSNFKELSYVVETNFGKGGATLSYLYFKLKYGLAGRIKALLKK